MLLQLTVADTKHRSPLAPCAPEQIFSPRLCCHAPSCQHCLSPPHSSTHMQLPRQLCHAVMCAILRQARARQAH